MKKGLVFTASASALIVGLLAADIAVAERGDGTRWTGDRDGKHQMHRTGGGRHGHHGQRGGMGMRGLDQLMETYDTNADGTLTQDELTAARAAQLQEFDTDGDGTLSIEEYEALWLDTMRERMVDRFQSHDDDGDGMVTVEEFGEEFENFVERRDRNGDGALSEDDFGRAQKRMMKRDGNGTEAPEQSE